MDLKKQRWYLIISLVLFLSISCNNKKTEIKNNKQLECVLNVFMDEPSRINEKYIYILERQNWDDSTSVITLYYSDIPLNNKFDLNRTKTAKFKNFKLIHILSSFNKSLNKNHLIPNKFDWKNINPKDYKTVSENEYLNFSEYELQIIYDFKNKKIMNVLKAYPLDESIVLDKIKNCNF